MGEVVATIMHTMLLSLGIFLALVFLSNSFLPMTKLNDKNVLQKPFKS